MKVTNANVRIVFTPNNCELFNNRKRFLVSPNTLHTYVGVSNAETSLNRFKNCSTDKCICKFRKYGKIEIYNK